MTAYNFKSVFAYRVEDGLKRQTVRDRRKRPTCEGMGLQLYSGMRTARCRKLLDAVCTGVLPVEIGEGEIRLAERNLTYPEIREFALRDGFLHPENLFEFFENHYGLPTQKEVIFWDVETVDRVVYGGLNVTSHLEGNLLGPDFVERLVQVGQTLWRTPSGCIVSVMPWDFEVWAREAMVLPWYLFTGIPATWTRYAL